MSSAKSARGGPHPLGVEPPPPSGRPARPSACSSTTVTAPLLGDRGHLVVSHEEPRRHLFISRWTGRVGNAVACAGGSAGRLRLVVGGLVEGSDGVRQEWSAFCCHDPVTGCLRYDAVPADCQVGLVVVVVTVCRPAHPGSSGARDGAGGTELQKAILAITRGWRRDPLEEARGVWRWTDCGGNGGRLIASIAVARWR